MVSILVCVLAGCLLCACPAVVTLVVSVDAAGRQAGKQAQLPIQLCVLGQVMAKTLVW